MGAFDFFSLIALESCVSLYERERMDPYNTTPIISVKRGLQKVNKKNDHLIQKDQPQPKLD
jgi:hypothetical protein